MNIQYPKITGKNSEEQLQQIRSFLFQLVQQLNMETDAQRTAGVSQSPGNSAQVVTSAAQGDTGGEGTAAGTPMSTFNQIKSLIIKSADIVNAYYEKIQEKLDSVYVASSEFGEYTRTSSTLTTETADGVEKNYESIQAITGQVNELLKTKANIRSGLLFVVGEQENLKEIGQQLAEGTEVYGVEVGQTTTKTVDGKETTVFNKFARFTAYGMALYDNYGNVSAYITDNRLNIPNAVVKNSMTRGGFVETINADGSSVERWVGV